MARSFNPGRVARSIERFYEAAGHPAFVHSEALDASFPE